MKEQELPYVDLKLIDKPPKEPKVKPRDGDPEITEPDSDEDSLFGAADLSSEEVFARDAGLARSPESATGKEVVERRLHNLEALYRIYKVEYWGLLEELRTRYQHYLEKTEVPVQEDTGQQRSGNTIDSHFGALRGRMKRRRKAKAESSPAADPGLVIQRDEAQDPATQPNDLEATAHPYPGDDARGSGSDSEPETFSEAEDFVIAQQGEPVAPKQAILQWRAQYRRQLGLIERLEQAASACTGRDMDQLEALACLCGRHNRFLVKTNAVSLGRATDASQVDIDLASEGDARKVSRHQAHLSLQPDGCFRLQNVGRRTVLVNNRQVDQGQIAQLGHLSLVEVGGVRLLFMVNHTAVKRAISRTGQLQER